MKLANYLNGSWIEGQGEGESLRDPVLGNVLVSASAAGINLGDALEYSRRVGGKALRKYTYPERAEMLGKIAAVLAANRDDYYRIALENSGSPRSDAAIDIDGAIYTLKYFAKEGSALTGARFLREGDLARLGKTDAFQVLHLAVPVRGAAILINAFNFPSWGMWEKAAPALLSGVPVLIKPATATAWLAQRMVEDVVKSGCLPEGALSLICGRAHNLLDHVTGADVIAFTGSAETAAVIRSAPAVRLHSARVNIEADSLNAALLGPDGRPGSQAFDLFVKEVVAEMTIKTGQKCTAIRRIIVPQEFASAVGDAIAAGLASVAVGNPRSPAVRMGPLVSKAQQLAVQQGLAKLQHEASMIFDGGRNFQPIDADPDIAAFVAPTLLACQDPARQRIVHEMEVFGPVATVVPYRDLDDAVHCAALGGGSLVASVFTDDPASVEQAVVELAAMHGRINVVTGEVAPSFTGHGNVMPMSLHGGPGRAGGGQELGGLRALRLYHQFSAIQAPKKMLESLSSSAIQLSL